MKNLMENWRKYKKNIIREELENDSLLSEAKKPKKKKKPKNSWDPKTMDHWCAEDNLEKHPVCGSPNRGTQFEYVIVAKINGLLARMKGDEDIADKQQCGKLYYNCPVPDSEKTMGELADDILKNKIPKEWGKINGATVYTGTLPGGGEPKTDIIIETAGAGFQNVSVKLGGTVQLASSEGRNTAKDFQNAFNDYRDKRQGKIEKQLETLAEQLKPSMKKKLKRDLDLALKQEEKALEELISLMMQAGYKDGKAIKYKDQKNLDKIIKETERDAFTAWENFEENYKVEISEKIEEVIKNNDELLTIYLDEALTGRRAFEDEEHIAGWLMSPDGVKSLNDPEIIESLKGKMSWGNTARAKSRKGVKVISYRLDFNPNKIIKETVERNLRPYEKILADALGLKEFKSARSAEIENKLADPTAVFDGMKKELADKLVENIKIDVDTTLDNVANEFGNRAIDEEN